MRTYRAEDGLVSAIADDINEIQNAVYQNITDRLGIIVKNHGLKGSDAEDFSLAFHYVGINVFQITCSNIGPVIFGDYVCIAGGDEVLSVDSTFATGQTKVLYVKKSLLYSNDQEDNFLPGHPVDEDEIPPASGYNIESEHILELGISSSSTLPTEQIVIIATATRINRDEIVFIDNRRSNSLAFNDFGLVQPNYEEIIGLQATPLLQDYIISSRSDQNEEVDKTPSHVNKSSNKVYAQVTWKPCDNTFMYQVRLQAIDDEGKKKGMPFFEIIPHIEGVELIETVIEVIEGLRYNVSIRSLSSLLNQDPGPWASSCFYAGRPVGNLVDICVSPELAVFRLNATSDEDYLPVVLQITAAVPSGAPFGSYVQIFKSITLPISGASSQADAKLIYEGDSPRFLYCIPEGETVYISTRLVIPGKICSKITAFDEPFYGNNVSEHVPREYSISVPLSFIRATSQTFPYKLFGFIAPSPHSKVRTMSFDSCGSYLNATADDPNLQCEIALGVEGSFPFIPGENEGQVAGTGDRLVWPSSNIPTKNGATPALTAEEYKQLDPNYSLRGSDYDNHEFVAGSEVSVWFTMSEWAATTASMIVAGTLTLVFNRHVVTEEPE